ncbi:unnamed protein product [Heterotrigona itama]|uniref:Uncharacterized protein n=1 Tax=Heterotrigona itama TaxID=395501 RepID=A0A6V7GWC6_9HYME|nr:unnamed protein product [Heterotrigona itama]
MRKRCVTISKKHDILAFKLSPPCALYVGLIKTCMCRNSFIKNLFCIVEPVVAMTRNWPSIGRHDVTMRW